MDKTTKSDSVSAVFRIFSILNALGEQKEIGVSELAQQLSMSKATIFRFLQSMKSLGYISQEGDTDKYALTLKLFELGSKALNYIDLIEIADKEMRYISKKTSEAIHLGSLDDNAIIYLHKIDSGYNLSMQSRIGRRNPLYSTAIGKVLLAECSKEFVKETLKDVEFIKHTENTLENIEQLLPELEKVRQQHFAEDNEEQELGLCCIAAPIYDRFGYVIAGLSISLPSIRYEKNQQLYYVGMLKTACSNISKKLGYQHYPD